MALRSRRCFIRNKSWLLNKLIDELVHPGARRDRRLWALDFLLHALVEKDLKKSIRKAIRYYGKV